jgi:hypothetical protein
LCIRNVIKKVKTQPIEWEKIFESDKDLVSIICKELLNKKTLKKRGKGFEKIFFQRRDKMAD